MRSLKLFDARSLPPLNLLVESRFPLDMTATMPEVRRLYDESKASRWNPLRDIDWSALEEIECTDEVREAARRTWSRRLWVEATGLTETPALVMRFCMEVGRDIDSKFFLTVRNTEEAWMVQCYDKVAGLLGGALERPSDPAYENAFNRNLHRRIMDADQDLDSYVACYSAFEDGLEYELARTWRAATTNSTLAEVLDHVIATKRRHAEFGWLYLQIRAGGWSDERRDLVSRALAGYFQETILSGYHCPWLSPVASAEARADEVTAAAGLGGASREEEKRTLLRCVENARQKLAEFGVALPALDL